MFIKGNCALYIDKKIKVYVYGTGNFFFCYESLEECMYDKLDCRRRSLEECIYAKLDCRERSLEECIYDKLDCRERSLKNVYMTN